VPDDAAPDGLERALEGLRREVAGLAAEVRELAGLRGELAAHRASVVDQSESLADDLAAVARRLEAQLEAQRVELLRLHLDERAVVRDLLGERRAPVEQATPAPEAPGAATGADDAPTEATAPAVAPRATERPSRPRKVAVRRRRVTPPGARDDAASPRERLAGIPGVGPAKQSAIIDAFGTVATLEGATVTELAAVPGIGPSLAARIHRHLHPGAG
jgi:hypothetical protein